MTNIDKRGIIVACSSCGQRGRIPFDRIQNEGRCASCSSPIGAPIVPLEITELLVFDALIAGAGAPVLVDFWAEWCAPCRAMVPELEKLARSFAGRIVVAKVNTERLPDIAIRYQIRSIPTLCAFSDGREAGRITGVRTVVAIEQFLQDRKLL